MKTFKTYHTDSSLCSLPLRRSVMLISCLALLVLCRYTHGQTGVPTTFNLYVSKNGNNLGAGNQAAPFRTIQWAIDHAPPAGATIKIGPGTYEECLVNVGKNIKLVGEPADPLQVVIDGLRIGTTLTITNCNSEFYGLTITNGRASDTQGGGAHLTNANAYFYGVVFSAHWNVIARGSAIATTGNSTLRMHNSLIYNNRCTYSIIDIKTGTAEMSNVTMTGNRAGIMINASSGAVLNIRNSIVYNSPYQPSYNYFEFANDGSCQIIVNYTNCKNKSDGTIQFGTGIMYDTDPKFVCPEENQYQLSSSSPCIDTGDPASGYNDKNHPPSRGSVRCDMGAYGGNTAARGYQAGCGNQSENPGGYELDRPDINTGAKRTQNYVYTVVPQTGTNYIPQNSNERSPDDYIESIQYADVFFRPKQMVSIAASPAKNNIVIEEKYDVFGRKIRQYLPYETGNNVSTVTQFYSSPHQGIPADTRPYSETIFESSPFNRINEQYGPGQVWKNNSKRQRMSHRTNTANEVRLWTAAETQVSSSGYYASGTLYVTETTDEDGRKVIEYVNLQERTVRQQQSVSDTENAITDFVYDNFGRKAYVLPPAIDKSTSRTISITGDDFTRFIYAYRYDHRQREVEKHIPGAGWTYTVYDHLDQPILTQNAVQRTRGEWAYVKYDDLGRVIISGLYTNSAVTTRAAMQTLAVDHWKEYRLPGGDYSNTHFPVSGTVVHTVNYYDNYDFPGSESYTGGDNRVCGLQTGSKVRVLDAVPEKWLYTSLYYDSKGQLIYSVSDHPKGGKDKITNQYDFTGKLLSSQRVHTGGEELTLTIKNKYDHAGRLLTVKQHLTGDTVTVAQNSYNELGQLIQTDLHDGTLESTKYEYNIRGWLTSIDGEYFKQRLHYHDVVGGLDNPSQWGGNISAMEWQAKPMNADWHAYQFKYDSLSRLKSGIYKKSATQGSSYGTTNAGFYNENYTYDIMGNIKALNRWHNHATNPIDQLTFSYNGNRLGGESDAISFAPVDPVKQKTVTLNTPAAAGAQKNCEGFVLNPGFSFTGGTGSSLSLEVDKALCGPEDTGVDGKGGYKYDLSGRMIADTLRGISIEYNHLGLVKQATQKTPNKAFKYTYDATGRRLTTILPDNTTRTYIDGIEYAGDKIEFISTPYGRIRKETSGWAYDYFLKDHLGNIRVVLTPKPAAKLMYTATMEESKAGEENLYFDNIESTRADRPYNYPDKNPTNAKLAKVPGKSKGPKLTLKVMAGDTIDISIQAFYNIDKTLPGQGVNIIPVLGNALAAMATGGTASLGEATQLAVDLGATASTSVALVNAPPTDTKDESPEPKSGLNFVVYNENFEVVEPNTGVLLVDDKINTIQNLSTDKIVIQESGYLEVFANNEAQTPVFFDNLTVTVSAGNVLEVNAYYPYGKQIVGLSSRNTYGANAYKYNGKELQDHKDFKLGWLDYGWRMFPTEDFPVWMVPDALAEMYYSTSPYMYCLGNPIRYIDPNGMAVVYGANSVTYTGMDAQVAFSQFKSMYENSGPATEPSPKDPDPAFDPKYSLKANNHQKPKPEKENEVSEAGALVIPATLSLSKISALTLTRFLGVLSLITLQGDTDWHAKTLKKEVTGNPVFPGPWRVYRDTPWTGDVAGFDNESFYPQGSMPPKWFWPFLIGAMAYEFYDNQPKPDIVKPKPATVNDKVILTPLKPK